MSAYINHGVSGMKQWSLILLLGIATFNLSAADLDGYYEWLENENRQAGKTAVNNSK